MAESVIDLGEGNSSIPKDGQSSRSGDSRIEQVTSHSTMVDAIRYRACALLY